MILGPILADSTLETNQTAQITCLLTEYKGKDCFRCTVYQLMHEITILQEHKHVMRRKLISLCTTSPQVTWQEFHLLKKTGHLKADTERKRECIDKVLIFCLLKWIAGNFLYTSVVSEILVFSLVNTQCLGKLKLISNNVEDEVLNIEGLVHNVQFSLLRRCEERSLLFDWGGNCI